MRIYSVQGGLRILAFVAAYVRILADYRLPDVSTPVEYSASGLQRTCVSVFDARDVCTARGLGLGTTTTQSSTNKCA